MDYQNYRYHPQVNQTSGISDEIQFLRRELENNQSKINSLINIIERNQHPEGRTHPILIEEGSDLEKKKIINGGKGTNEGNLSSKHIPNTF